MADSPVLVGIPEIAEIAGVTRSAVSNWRKRYNDFPEPRVQTESGVLFDMASIEEWLLARAKLTGPIPPGALVWRFADAVRGAWTTEQFAAFLSSWLVYLEACDRARRQETAGDPSDGVPVNVPLEHRWESVRRARDEELPDRLRRAAKDVERRNHVLNGLLEGLAPEPFPDTNLLRAFVAQLEGAAASDESRIGLFEDAQRRVHALDRFSGEFDTPDDVVYLMSRLAGSIVGGATVVDPAVGSGGLLLMWAVGDTRPSGPVDLLGVDVNEAVARHARARVFIYGVEARIRCADALRLDPAEWLRADVVLLDPPMGVGGWGDASLYRDNRWVFGAPPANSADMAWVQLSVSMLKPTGRAVVSLPVGSLTRGGAEAEIRQSLIDRGAVEAVVELPARLRRNTSIPTVLWLLRAPAERGSDAEVLLVDASRLGTSGRSEHELSSEDVERIVHIVERWRDGHDVVLEDDAPPEELVPIALAPWDIADADLSPRRYWTVGRPGLAGLRHTADELRWELRSTADSFMESVTSLLHHEPPLVREGNCPHGMSSPAWCTECREERTTASPILEKLDDADIQELLSDLSNQPDMPTTPCVRLGDVAEVLTATSAMEGSAAERRPDDIRIRATAGGFVIESGDVVDPARLSGRALVIRPRNDQSLVTSEWLRVWTASSRFGDLLEQHARGTTVRSVPAREVVEFAIPVPSGERQRAAAALAKQVDAAASKAAIVVQTLEELRRVEIDRAVAQATEAPT